MWTLPLNNKMVMINNKNMIEYDNGRHNGEMTTMEMVDINEYCVQLLFFLVCEVDSIRGGLHPTCSLNLGVFLACAEYYNTVL